MADKKMVKFSFNLIIFPLIKPQVANQQKNLSGEKNLLKFSPKKLHVQLYNYNFMFAFDMSFQVNCSTNLKIEFCGDPITGKIKYSNGTII